MMQRRMQVVWNQTDYKLEALAPVADATAVVVGLFFLTTLQAWLNETRGLAVAAVLGVFILFCAAVYIVRKLAPAAGVRSFLPDWLFTRPLMVGLALVFSLSLAILLLGQLGYWEEIFQVNDRKLGAGESSAFFVYAPSAFIGFCFFYILVLSGETRQTILPTSGRYLPMVLFALLAINGMMLWLTAVLCLFGLGGGWLAIALLLLFVPPRLWYARTRPSLLPLVSFAVMLLLVTVMVG